jgi:CPA2 family monovalent cation:H+ antiporter-2/glutathione-regulated potassium-efflux system protein KefB
LAVQVLLAEQIDVTVIDNSITRIRDAARFGFKVYYGDGTRLDVLRAAGAEQARIIAVCIDQKQMTSAIVEMAKASFPLARVHARAYDRIHSIELLRKGTDYQIRETAQSALAFGGATLGELIGDKDRASEVVEAVSRRDSERLALQLAGGFASPYQPLSKPIEPEPLTKPKKKTRGLNRESQNIVDSQEIAEAQGREK